MPEAAGQLNEVGPLSAIVLAAGRSTRMGRDKALLEVEGVPLWRRQRDILVTAGATELFLSARPEWDWAHAVTSFSAVLYDAVPDQGPLVGLTAGLERASHPWLAVLAVDLPEMSAAWFRTLATDLRPNVGVVGLRDGHFEPLAAIYPTEFKWLAWEALARGERALQPVLARAVETGVMCGREIRADEAAWFRNWNEVSDRAD